MALMNFLLNIRMILLSRWIHNHVRHIEFHVCPDHEEWEEVRDRLKGAIEAHLREVEPLEGNSTHDEIKAWDNGD